MSECKARPRSSDPHCRCPKCKPAATVYRRRRRKLRALGITSEARSAAAWRVVDQWLAEGKTAAAIGSLTGLSRYTVMSALSARKRGTDHRWSPSSVDMILAAWQKKPVAAKGYVSALGARRRLQALSALGWSLDDMEAACGIQFTSLAAVRSGKTARVHAKADAPIRDMYKRLHMTPGPSQKAATVARGKGWVPPLAWDNIDDPMESPSVAGKTHLTGTGMIADLLAFGITDKHTLAHRTGLNVRTVERLIARLAERDAAA